MVVRKDLLEGIKIEMSTWFYDAASPLYKTLERFYPDMVEVGDIKDLTGGYWKGTSALGSSELEDLDNYGDIHEDNPTEGYTVYARIKSKALRVKCPRVLKRDWHRTTDWLKNYVSENWPQAVEVTKEKIVANFYNKGGWTSGDDIYNNDDADIGLTTYTSPKLQYDGEPVFNLSDNTRSAKNGSTYYNAIQSGVAPDYPNVALPLFKLLTSTNAYMENGNPFDNGQDLIVVTAKANEPAWKIINNSTLVPGDSNNDSNPLQGIFKKIVANPYITYSYNGIGMSVMQRRAKGIKFWVGKPRFNFWEVPSPEAFWASCTLDYAITLQNFRPLVADNAPITSTTA